MLIPFKLLMRCLHCLINIGLMWCQMIIKQMTSRYALLIRRLLILYIEGVHGTVRGLHYTDAMISLIHPIVVQDVNLPREGVIKLDGLYRAQAR